jgi:hypothetical protein
MPLDVRCRFHCRQERQAAAAVRKSLSSSRGS